MSEMEIKTINHDDQKAWDALVRRAPHATAVHQLDWLHIIEHHTKSKLFLFAGYSGNQIVAAVPFFAKKKKFYSPIGNAMIQNLGPIFPDYDRFKPDKREYNFSEFQKKLDDYIIDNFNPDFTLIITTPKLLDARPYIWSNYTVSPRYNYIKNIENLDDVWEGFKYKLRKNIEGAEKAGISIEEGSLEEYKFIINLTSKRYRDQNLEFPTSYEYFLDIYRRFYPENIKVFIAKDHGEPITGVIVITFKDRISFWCGATKTDLKGVYPVDLLLWKVIEWGSKNGYKFCEHLGANVPSISFFKSRYNFDLEIYFEAKKVRGFYRVLNEMRYFIRG